MTARVVANSWASGIDAGPVWGDAGDAKTFFVVTGMLGMQTVAGDAEDACGWRLTQCAKIDETCIKEGTGPLLRPLKCSQ